MPHIDPNRRTPIARGVDTALAAIENPGELTYAMYRLAVGYAARNGDARFRDWMEAHGSLGCAAAELYRLKVGPYEDTAIARNGVAC